MADKTTPPTVRQNTVKEESRLLPLAVAASICFVIAVVLGYGAWLLLNSKTAGHPESPAVAEVQPTPPAAIDTPLPTAAPTIESPAPTIESPAPAALPTLEEAEKLDVEGTVNVTGGEFTIGGGQTKLPLKRVIIKDFVIAETEVTNSQYAEFVAAAKHAAPNGWKNGRFAKGQENFPVTGVSWNDANDYCVWLSSKIGQSVRLPTEAEWELAARGKEGFHYPWGNDWKKDAVVSAETGGKISAVKSSEMNRSPFGAYDMAGSVWEWTADKLADASEASDKFVVKALKDKKTLRIVKGGTSKDKANQISAQVRYEIPESTKVGEVGFRYIVVAK